MRIVYFAHSLVSCWNHGNAHFLRGVLRALKTRGHMVTAYEPARAWSRENLVSDHGEAALEPWRTTYPDLDSTAYGPDFDPADACSDADLVLVHEWNDPGLIARLGHVRAQGGRFSLLFHDTHHRAVSAPEEMAGYDLCAYDGVLAFGETLADVYRRMGWDRRVWVWHEAADVTHFHPPAEEHDRRGLVWIGNWGDGERTAELETFLLAPAQEVGLPLDIFGVRYPPEALALLARYGAGYCGWLANVRAPEVFARHLATVHVPRRFYATQLSGIPTIRMFEALACGIPLVSAPWEDSEHLFRPGVDYLTAGDGAQMRRCLRTLRDDPAARAELVRSGLETIRARHTCGHRADELLAIAASLRPEAATGSPARIDA